ncbi:LON peptidase substrate-binding domain-containing protein [Prosthecomicrobium pneumaticum]|uniref:Lon N-terminal domain-containing protein n=1 Tax=Prosthecomicrobium pneumaticum TaxID=81895 RepID=A0A7W9L2M2_9HYPH|nr:LON peptidase substrate-binding domain-containing protein [Prosthecomicrobium pneumaticum]MBB5753639.1 hypothetical protein [Prosthecomicrobium pneumaticum]
MRAGNRDYGGPADIPAVVPVFPLPSALLLPRGQLPLNIFEPRYVAMIDAAMAGERVIGMVQPLPGRGLSDDPAEPDPPLCRIGCLGRITSYAETGDGRYMITLTGVARFDVVEELAPERGFRRCRISAAPFAADFVQAAGERAVDRKALIACFRAYLEANHLEADWESIGQASNETLVNALSMMCPFGPAEKQALLEAPDLKTRAETLIAITEVSLVRGPQGGSAAPLQ